MKKRNRALALLLASTMALTGMTACGGDAKTEEGSSETAKESTKESEKESGSGTNMIMAWWGNQVRNEKTQQALDKYHELNSDVTVEGQFFQWDDYWSKMATSAAGKNMPDLIQMDYAYIDQYVNNGQLLDLTPYMESGALDVSNIPDNVLEMGVVGEGNYGIAAGVSGNCMYYNKTLLDELGIEWKDNTNWDDFVEIAKEVTEKSGYRAMVMYEGGGMGEWARAAGIPIVEPKMPVDSADGYVEYFQRMEDGVKDGWLITPDVVESNATEQNPLVYGSSPEMRAWCAVSGTSNMLTALQNAAPEGTDIEVTTYPSDDVKTSNFLKPAMYFSISADTKDPDAAVALLNWLINSKEANEILLGERGVPASTKVADEIFDLVTETEQESFKFVTDVITPNCSPINPPDPEGSSELGDTLKKVSEKICYGQATAQEAAEEYYNKGIEIWGE